MTAQEAQRLVAAWRSLWPSASWRAEDMRLVLMTWAAVLADIDYAEAEAVIIAIARDGAEFPPTPGQIAERVLTLREQRDGTACPDIDRALAEVRHYVTTRGMHHGEPEQWSHPAVAAAVHAIGWADLCSGGDTTRAHFIRAYEAAKHRHRERRRMAPAMQAVLAAAPIGQLNAG